MADRKNLLFGIVVLVIGASGLGLGTYSVVNFQKVEGPPGQDGQDIIGLQVGILDPDQYEIVSGLVEVRILLWNSSRCSINVFVNGSLNATSVPWVWDTTKASDGWYNISVRATDAESNVAQDKIMVYVLNNPNITPRARVYVGDDYEAQGQTTGLINFDTKNYDTTNDFNLTSDSYIVPENGYYLTIASIDVVVNIILDHPYHIFQLYIHANSISVAETRMYISEITWLEHISISASTIVYLSEGDNVQVLYYTVFTNLINHGSSRTFFAITKLSD